MSENREAVVEAVRALRDEAEKAGIVEVSVWTSLDDMWKGPDVDLSKIAVLAADTMSEVRKAHARSQLTAGMVNRVLDLAKVMLPLAMAAV